MLYTSITEQTPFLRVAEAVAAGGVSVAPGSTVTEGISPHKPPIFYATIVPQPPVPTSLPKPLPPLD